MHAHFALIYVYRESSFAAGAEAWEVSLDDNVVGRLFPNAYLMVHAAPGTHWLLVRVARPTPPGLIPAATVGLLRDEDKPKEFQAESGDVFYLRCTRTEHDFVPRERAIDTLRTMKYDQGN